MVARAGRCSRRAPAQICTVDVGAIDRSRDELRADVGREEREKRCEWPRNVTVLAKDNVEHARLEKMTCVQRDEATIERRIEGNVCKHGDAHSELDVSFADIRVRGSAHDARIQPGFRKSRLDE